MEAVFIASAAMSAVSAISQGQAQAAQARSAQDTVNYNATVNEQNAQTALQAANANEEAQRRKSAQDMGRVRAGVIENLGAESGSATDLTEDSAMNAELDALNIRYGGQTQARAYKTGAALDRQQAEQAGINANNALTSGYLTAGASALSSYGRYSGYKNRLKINPNATPWDS